ncbi:MAG: RluA family pseudouridine synthase [bacterium]
MSIGHYTTMLHPEKTNYTFHIPEPCFELVQVVFTDEHLLVVCKPSGLLSVPGRIVKDCVLNRMLVDHPDVRTVHRLDLDTSGLMMLALSKEATSDLNRQFRERTIKKEYIALVHGELDNEEGEIDLPIRADPDNRPLQVVDLDSGKASLTRYQVIDAEEGYSRVRLMPVTGRSHQLRLHLSAIGHPILGCDLYAHEEAFQARDRLSLHASKIQFDHPGTKKLVTFESTVPF